MKRIGIVMKSSKDIRILPCPFCGAEMEIYRGRNGVNEMGWPKTRAMFKHPRTEGDNWCILRSFVSTANSSKVSKWNRRVNINEAK